MQSTAAVDTSRLRLKNANVDPNSKKGKPWGKPFQPGQSGNPGGKAKTVENLGEIARTATPKAIRTLIDIMTDSKASYAVRAYCAEKVIDRAYGKAPQQTNLSITGSQRSIRDLSDNELMAIIEMGRAKTAVNNASPPLLEQSAVEVEPTLGVEQDIDHNLTAEADAAPHAEQDD